MPSELTQTARALPFPSMATSGWAAFSPSRLTRVVGPQVLLSSCALCRTRLLPLLSTHTAAAWPAWLPAIRGGRALRRLLLRLRMSSDQIQPARQVDTRPRAISNSRASRRAVAFGRVWAVMDGSPFELFVKPPWCQESLAYRVASQGISDQIHFYRFNYFLAVASCVSTQSRLRVTAFFQPPYRAACRSASIRGSQIRSDCQSRRSSVRSRQRPTASPAA